MKKLLISIGWYNDASTSSRKSKDKKRKENTSRRTARLKAEHACTLAATLIKSLEQ